MKKTPVLKYRLLLCLAALVLLAAAGSSSSLAAEAKRLNVVLIISDDQGWKDYGFMGHPQIKTPHLDKLASQSLVFTRGYVPSSICCPSLASMLTGRYPHQHKITCQDPPHPKSKTLREAIDDPEFRAGRETINGYMRNVQTIPRVLAPLGYGSLQTGKWWQGHFSNGGFTQGMSQDDPKHMARHGDEGLKIGRETMQPLYDFMAESQRANKPFFVWYAPMLPHQPHNPPERLLAKYRGVAPSLFIAKYWAMVEWFDETCGLLLDFLDQQNLASNTLVLYLSDNGWIQEPNAARFDPRSKQSPYDGGNRTPIMIRWPGNVAAQRSTALASSLDLLPTIAAATGAKPPADLPGVNLLSAALAARTHLFGEGFTHDYVDVGSPARNVRFRWIIKGEWKLIIPNRQNEPERRVELYNLTKDPDEAANRAEDEPKLVESMRQTLDAWWAGK
jgi:uncharacterized sulfatase